ncbi:MAG: patatin-like phospholipase family protein [bacterium]|nr:patatin-like phospholipase family protein [bacterium]
MKTKKKIGLVLGSGGARGLVQIGVLKVLDREKIFPEIIVGSSMGAFIGGIYATGVSVKKMEQVACQTNIKLTAKMLTPGLPTSGIVDLNRVRNFLKELGANVNIEDLNVNFAAIATDFTTGEEFILNSGLLVDAITASVALPVLFKPVYYQNKFLVDGGIINPLPVNIAYNMGATNIIAVNVAHSPGNSFQKKNGKPKRTVIIRENLSNLRKNIFKQMKKINNLKLTAPVFENYPRENNSKTESPEAPGIINNMLQSAYILENKIIQLQLQLAKPDILISPDVSDFNMLHFHRAKELIAIGEKAGLEMLPQIKEIVNTKL